MPDSAPLSSSSLTAKGAEPAVTTGPKPSSPEGGDKQQVIRPDGGKPLPGLLGGERPQPA